MLCRLCLATILSILCTVQFQVIWTQDYPDIIVRQVSSIDKVTQEVNFSYNEGGQGFFSIPSNFEELHFECRSMYPTRWVLVPSPQREGSNLKQWFIHKTRRVLNVSDHSTYSFSSTLTMHFTNMKNRKLEQFVACRHGGSMPLINRNLTLTSVAGNLEGLLTQGEKLTRMGAAGGTRYGRNKNCDLVLYLDKVQNTLACQSRSNKSLKPPNKVKCLNPDECETEVQSEICTSALAANEKSVQPFCSLPTCTKLASSGGAGAIVCETTDADDPGSSLAQIIYFTLENPPRMFTDRVIDEIDTSRVLVLNVGSSDHDMTLYVNQSLRFTCSASVSCFSAGIQWAIQVGDEEVKYLGAGSAYLNATRGAYESSLRIHFNSSGGSRVFCLGPVWNNYTWENVSELVTVNAPVLPVISGEETTEIRWTAESVILICMASGTPLPNLTWLRNGIKMEQGNAQPGQNDSYSWTELVLESNILELGKSVEVYTCLAQNVVGSSVKHFRVLIDHAGHTHITESTHLGLAVGLPLLVIVLLIIILYGYLRLRVQDKNISRLTEDEIMEFNNGDPHSPNSALFYPYNTEYEVSRKKFNIESKVLGKGQFGLVIKGKIGRAPVAIKTVKKSADIAYLKALLSELKIMIFVGKHDNIVNLIGACTEGIHNREVYIICEFCSNGNVMKYVQASRQTFVDHLSGGGYGSSRISTVDYQNISVKKLSSKDLLRWAYEIACGMEFLSRQNVVHGDLAARNILLDDDLTAKVGDFGLSKQLFEYSIYVQKLECPLPLKWMAIESLRDLEFSVQSDIWSYGVTLWEIFSLGQVPYPGIQWDSESWKMLRDGYRMDRPSYASDIVYQLLLQCWDAEPSARPRFSTLKNAFEEQMIFNKIQHSKKYY